MADMRKRYSSGVRVRSWMDSSISLSFRALNKEPSLIMCLLNAYSCSRASNGVSGDRLCPPPFLQRGVQSTRKSLHPEAITTASLGGVWGVVWAVDQEGFRSQAWVIVMQSCVRACPLIGPRGPLKHPSTGGHKILPSWVVIWAWAGGGRVAEQHRGRIPSPAPSPFISRLAEKPKARTVIARGDLTT